MKKITETKEKILNSLSDKFEVKNVARAYDDGDIGIIVEFMFNGKFGTCRITLEGKERGIDWCEYKEEDEDVYAEILDWFWDSEEINWETSIKYKGKELK